MKPHSPNTAVKSGSNLSFDTDDLQIDQLLNSKEEKAGAKIRRRNSIISVIFLILFIALLVWAANTGKLADTNEIRTYIEKAGPFGPLLFILISVFTSYIPVVPLGSMGSIGIVLFGLWPASIYNSITSILNCILAYWLARKYGVRILLWFAAPQTIGKYLSLMKKSRHLELLFFIVMLLPVSPDLVWCMLAGILHMNFSHFLIMTIISRPVSSFCYSNGLLRVFDWLRSLLHF